MSKTHYLEYESEDALLEIQHLATLMINYPSYSIFSIH